MATIAALEPDARPRERLSARGADSSPTASCWRSCSGRAPAARARSTSRPRCCAGSGACRGCCARRRASSPATSGIGAVRATLVLAALELGRRAVAGRPIRGQRLAGASEVWTYFRGRLAPLSVEEFWALGLDVRHRVQSENCLARGSLTGVEIHPRDVFRPLIRQGTAAVIFCHNHPSGDPAPSRADIELTGAPARRRRSRAAFLCSITSSSGGRASSAWPSGIGADGIHRGYAATIPRASLPAPTGICRRSSRVDLASAPRMGARRVLRDPRARHGRRVAGVGGRGRGPLLNPSGMSLVKNFQVLEGAYGYSSRLSRPLAARVDRRQHLGVRHRGRPLLHLPRQPSPPAARPATGTRRAWRCRSRSASRATLGGDGEVLQPVGNDADADEPHTAASRSISA